MNSGGLLGIVERSEKVRWRHRLATRVAEMVIRGSQAVGKRVRRRSCII